MSEHAPDWSVILDEARVMPGLDEDEPVPRGEVVDVLQDHGYTENEAEQLLRNTDALELANDDPTNPKVILSGGGDSPDIPEQYRDIPDALRERDIWLMWDSAADRPKRPHWRGDFHVSWSDPDVWHSFEEAVKASQEKETWGIGYVNHEKNGVVTIDIDGSRGEDGRLKDWVPSMGYFTDDYVERSPSGTGDHIPLIGYDVPDWWTDVSISEDHEGVDVLENKFCTCTGNKIIGGGDEVRDVSETGGREIDEWLAEAYERAEGESPREKESSDLSEYDDSGSGEVELTDEQVEEALDHLDPDMPYTEWRNIGFALLNHYGSSARAQRVFEKWSRTGSKYDDDTDRLVEDITSRKANGGVTVGTLIHKAKEAGWEPEFEYSEPEPNPVEVNGEHEPDDDGQKEGDDGDENNTEKKFCLRQKEDIARAVYPDKEEVGFDDLEDTEIALGVQLIVQRSDEHNFLVSNDEMQDIFAYRDGLWSEKAERYVKPILRTAVPAKNSPTMQNKLTHHMTSEPMLWIDRDEMGVEEGKIATEDGLLDVLGGDIQELEPEDRAMSRIETGVEPEADCPTFLEYIRDSCSDADLRKLQEYAGYLLWHQGQPKGKAMFLVGPTDSGKGTFIDIMETILGADNISSESLQNLISTRWGPARMYGKIANMRNEVAPEGVSDVETFKELTGGEDRITAEYKGEKKFEYTVTQKQIFSTNQFPVPDNADEAFWNRCLFAEFPTTIPEDEQDPMLIRKIEDEKEGVLNWMLEGVRRLADNNWQFSDERDIGSKKEVAASYGSPLQRFKFNCVNITGNEKDIVDRSDIHDVYVAYAKKELDRSEDDLLGQGGLTKRLNRDDRIEKKRSRKLTSGDGRDTGLAGLQIESSVLQHFNMDGEVAQSSAAEEKGSGQTGFSR
jgi:putative DNA primase/helicase